MRGRVWVLLLDRTSLLFSGSRATSGSCWWAGRLYTLASCVLASWQVADMDPHVSTWVDVACTLHWEICCVLGGPCSAVNGCCDDRFDAPSAEQTGRATCGESEGREFVSNYNPTLVQGVKCVEYWGRSHSSPVPRVFGGASA